MERWPHQIYGVRESLAAFARGERLVLLTSPTGGGKTRIMSDIADDFLQRGHNVILYTNRVLLLDQLSAAMNKYQLDHGTRAAGHAQEANPFQISSIQTEHSRVTKKGTWGLYDAGLVLIDEAHSQKGATVKKIIDAHHQEGACVLGLTATPVDLAGLYQTIIQAGTVGELQACGALVPCRHYGCDEPDLRLLGRLKIGEDISAAQQAKVIKVAVIFGRVYNEWRRINPQAKSTLLFAPGVEESIGFCEQFEAMGVRAAHIDGKGVWLAGKTHPSSQQMRAEVLGLHRDNKIKVLCNRFVLREGFDAPWIQHGIFACIFGSLSSYLQAGGRLLRAYPGVETVTVQDHGGCLDASTEILTPRGWVGCDGIRDDDLVAAFDRYNGSISWRPILHRHDRFLETGEKMFAANGRQCDIRVTGNHRLLFNKRTCDADSRPIWPDNFDMARADELAGSRVRFKVPISGVQRAPGVALTDDQLRFIGWFLTDGTMAGKRQAVSISQANHQPQIGDLRACLTACGFDFRETQVKPNGFPGAQPATKFHIPKGTCRSRPREGWWPLRYYLDKNLATCLELVDERQFAVLLHAIHLGDGDKAKADGSYRISTGNRTFADRLQSLCVRRGWKCNLATSDDGRLNPLFVLNIQKAGTLTLHGRQGQEGQTRIEESASLPGVTRVWCVANELETLVTRRNGKVAIIGNSWWRHGSLNADRTWRLGDTNALLAAMRDEKLRSRRCVKCGAKVTGRICGACGVTQEREPSTCPQCRQVLNGTKCPCGFVLDLSRKSRLVVQEDGTLAEHFGDVFRPRVETRKPDTDSKWRATYYRAKNSKMTFRQAEALFVQDHGYYPPRDLKLMPRALEDFFRRVKDVPADKLR